VFYPKGLQQAHELEFASRVVDTIEINGSHYSLQTIGSYESWYAATPAHFVFSVKGPRYLTHMLRFQDDTSKPAIANFFASGVLALKEKLGPFLWQFPPNYAFEPARLNRFLALLPRDTGEAAALASQHDARVKQPWFGISRQHRLRHAIEIRHPSFARPDFIKTLREHRVALVISDSVAGWPYAEDLTADFIYMRLHGTQSLYGGAYTDEGLDHWASRIRSWSAGSAPPDAKLFSPARARARKVRDVFCYFDNDEKVRAPFDAQRLMTRLSDA
jgi:uncharacterized protein YecE (DUF72 family)